MSAVWIDCSRSRLVWWCCVGCAPRPLSFLSLSLSLACSANQHPPRTKDSSRVSLAEDRWPARCSVWLQVRNKDAQRRRKDADGTVGCSCSLPACVRAVCSALPCAGLDCSSPPLHFLPFAMPAAAAAQAAKQTVARTPYNNLLSVARWAAVVVGLSHCAQTSSPLHCAACAAPDRPPCARSRETAR
jgi:hypothetical protein